MESFLACSLGGLWPAQHTAFGHWEVGHPDCTWKLCLFQAFTCAWGKQYFEYRLTYAVVSQNISLLFTHILQIFCVHRPKAPAKNDQPHKPRSGKLFAMRTLYFVEVCHTLLEAVLFTLACHAQNLQAVALVWLSGLAGCQSSVSTPSGGTCVPVESDAKRKQEVFFTAVLLLGFHQRF